MSSSSYQTLLPSSEGSKHEASKLFDGDQESREVLLLIFLSFSIFQILSRTLSSSRKVSVKNANTLGSFVHSLTSSAIIFFTIMWNQEMFISFDLEEIFFSQVGSFARIWSAGYFLSDLVDMIRCNTWNRSIGLVFHHLACIISLSVGALKGVYAPIHLLFLLAEFNSTFLHLRAILRMRKIHPDSFTSRLNAAAFWFTYWMFRNVISIGIFYLMIAKFNLFLAAWHVVIGMVASTIIVAANSYLYFQVSWGDRRYRSQFSEYEKGEMPSSGRKDH